MKLAILNLTGGGISGGYQNYLQNILPRLAADSRIESVLCVSPASLGVEVLVPANRKILFASCAPFRPFMNGVDMETEQLLASYGPDVIFVPTARAARFRNVPVVTMIQNMAPLVSWKWYGIWQKFKLLAQMYEAYRAVLGAVKVIAISEFVKNYLTSKWNTADDKIVPIYFGVPLHSLNAQRPGIIPADWKNFVFSAGSIEPYRSYEDIIQCADFSRKSLRTPIKIVIAGTPRPGMRGYESQLKRMAEKAGVAEDICWAGQLPHEEMTWCYRNCSVFVMTSRVEAGPNTVLEAMACGAVCVAADNQPLPEFFADAAKYYPPGDAESLAVRIQEVLTLDGPGREHLAAASRLRAAKFTWEETTERTLKLFSQVCGQK